MIAATLDQSGLDFMLNGVKNALIGIGGDASTLAADESRLLALEISKRARPMDRKKTAKRIDASVRSTFLAVGSEQSSFENHPEKQGDSGVKWYRCDSKFLYGIAPDKDMRQSDVSDLAKIYYHTKKIEGKSRIISDFKHPRKRQRVAIVQKIITSKSLVRKTVALVQRSIGKLPASWVATAKKIKPSTTAPQWIERHIKAGASSRSITDLSGLNRIDSPSVTFGSKASGVTSFQRVIQFAVNTRETKLAARLKLILSGYSKDVAQGIRVKRHAHETKGQE